MKRKVINCVSRVSGMDKPVGYCPLTLRVNLGMDVGSGGGSSMPLGFNPPPPGGDIGGSSKQYWSVAQGRFVELPNNHIWNYVVGENFLKTFCNIFIAKKQ